MLSQTQSNIDLKTLLQEAATRSPTGHFCHMTSVYYHGLTNQVPARVYLRKPKGGTRTNERPQHLPDLQIRKEFLKPHRRTGNVIPVGNGSLILISGSASDQIGVIPVASNVRTFPKKTRITNLERCLIDAVVAPHYNGGIFSLPEIFENAAETLDTDRLIAQYRDLNFLYPYCQTLGFFLDHTGQSVVAESLRKAFPPRNRFFVDKAAKSTWPYNADWQVHYPTGLINEH